MLTYETSSLNFLNLGTILTWATNNAKRAIFNNGFILSNKVAYLYIPNAVKSIYRRHKFKSFKRLLLIRKIPFINYTK